MLITEMLANNARTYGKETALVELEPAIEKRTEISWETFDEISNRICDALKKKGVNKGNTVIHLMKNCIEWLPVYFGILRTGALAVPLNFRFDPDSVRRCVAIAEAKAFFFASDFIEHATLVKNSSMGIETFIYLGPDDLKPDFAITFKSFVDSGENVPPGVQIDISDSAGLYFTSGTTGNPKAVLLTHGNLESACYVENHHHRQTHDDNFLCIPPLYHTGAKMHWFGNLLVGAKAVILKGIQPQWILRAISDEKVTIVWLLVPWALDILFALENGDAKLEDYDLSSWRLMHIGAQPVPPSLVQEWKKVFPHHQYDTNFGLTESTGPGCVHLGMENLHKVGAIGLPGLGWETKIVDSELHEVPPGEVGELAVKGPGRMKEYFRNPTATEEVLKDGWLLTGDMARQDADGFIWLVDRKKDVIIMGGENIFPVEIENFIQAHPKVQDVAVIGLPNDRLGEIPAAIVQVKRDQQLGVEELNEYCRSLPRYKRPRRVILAEVPRNATGKIEKPKLRKQYS